jgi:hypothetical protein
MTVRPLAGGCGIVRHHDALNLLQFLDARLHLLGLGRLIAEAIDERFEILDALLLIFVRVHQLRLALFLLLHVFLVSAVIDMRTLVPHLHDLAHGHVQKVAVVRDQHKRILVVAQIVFEPVARLQIEVVGRLVEQQQRRLFEQQLGQRDAHLPAAGELFRAPLPVLLREAQAPKHRANLRIERIDIVGMQHIHDVRVTCCRLRVFRGGGWQIAKFAGQLLGLGFHIAQLVEDAEAFIEDGLAAHRQAVLREVADGHALLARHRTVVERFHAAQHLQHGGLAGAVTADQPGPFVRRDEPVHLFKQQLGSKPLSRAREL